MVSLGEVLARLHGARDSFSTLRGTVRLWHDARRTNEAWQRWMSRQSPGSVSDLTGPQKSVAPQPSEQVVRLWMAKPWRWRVEREQPSQASPGLTVIDGPVWWIWDGQSQAVTNEGSATQETRGGGLDRALVVMLDPAPILSALFLRIVGEGRQAGRDGLRVVGTPRNDLDDVLWPGADEYDLLVDAERGILLRSVAHLGDTAYAGNEFLEVAFDEDLPPDIFTFRPAPGVRVRRVSAQHQPAGSSRVRKWHLFDIRRPGG